MDAVYATDEYGRPFIIVREQDKKSRISGLDAQKVGVDSAGIVTIYAVIQPILQALC